MGKSNELKLICMKHFIPQGFAIICSDNDIIR